MTLTCSNHPWLARANLHHGPVLNARASQNLLRAQLATQACWTLGPDAVPPGPRCYGAGSTAPQVLGPNLFRNAGHGRGDKVFGIASTWTGSLPVTGDR